MKGLLPNWILIPKHFMELLKETINAQKLRGGYYTPQEITDFLCEWAIRDNDSKILEPSCGDGNFVESSILRLKKLGGSKAKINKLIRGIELALDESKKAKDRVKKMGIDQDVIINSDFFHYVDTHKKEKYDVILGNPPFIRYQNFPEGHRSLAIRMMNELGLTPNKLTNIWVPFLVISSSLLAENGRLAMVIPAELFQVKYAEETRIFLSKYFERINIITFKKLVFSNIQQEVVLLLCEKKVSHGQGIRTIECERLDDLKSLDFNQINGSNVKSIDHTSEKWTKYFLTEEEISLLKKLKTDKRIYSCADIMVTNVGIVTGRNDFFLLNEGQVEEWKLGSHTIPIVGRSHQLRGIGFSDIDFQKNSEAENAMYLFLPENKNFSGLPLACQKYIKFGEREKFHTGYKCKIRKNWYVTPSLWIPDAFALRQISDFPKLILNETGASSTDTIHRVKFKKGIDKKLAAVCFLNSLSFAFSEVVGRSYGGGVMTFEPTEIGEIRIPLLAKIGLNFKKIDKLVRERKIQEVLDIVDNAFLIKHHKFTKKEVALLRGIWEKLRDRRLNRKK